MLHLHRAARADVLAAALASLLSDPPPDPFAAEIVAVPTAGMERWLTQRMSSVLGASEGRADGVCANVSFPTPHRLVADAVAVASGVDPDADPWLPERALWPLLDVVDACLDEPWLAELAGYLGGSDVGDPVRRARRLSVVRHLAGLFDRYALHRPEMLAGWAAGRDRDASGEALPTGMAWQAELWRRLRDRIGVAGPAERRADACARLTAEPGLLALPDRVSLFGLTRLPAGHLQVLRALADGRDVHLFLLHPSPALWTALARAGFPATPRRASDDTAKLVDNRLLASWGRDAREMQLVLESATPVEDHDHDPQATDPSTLLARLQADIRADRAAPGAPLDGGPDGRAPLAAQDGSIVVHSCHGRVRQVEVLRDAILHALAHDPTLEPRDVIVMCPDIEAFAPLIQATFGAGGTGGAQTSDGTGDPDATIDLRVRLADRSLTQTNPVLAVVAQLMELVGERLTASQVLDLADRAPVRRRFRLDDDDLTRLQDWIAQGGIRWGLDAEHRAPYRLADVREGTWRAGLDRLLLGVTMTEDDQRLFADVLPLDDVDSRSIELAGRFSELVARVQGALDAMSASQPLAEWARTIADATDALTATAERDRWQRAELQRILDVLVREASGAESVLAPSEARAHLAARLQGRPTRANFRTGHLTVCTLMPMRSVPHRVVCLLGLDDGAFPRRAPRDGDDLMLSDPHLGERDPRSEDRQLLLDALLAATERLIVTYTGNDERTNTPRPPAVPVGELLDAVDATVTGGDRIIVRHPLQPFDPLNFAPGELGGPGPWSFDDVALGGARALAAGHVQTPPFLTTPLPALAARAVDLDELVRFVEHPVRAFLRRRLGITLRDGGDELDDGLPIELDGLGRWDVGQRLLEAMLRGTSMRVAARAEKARGTLPPGALGDRVIDDVRGLAIGIATEATGLITPGADRDPFTVRVTLADGRLVTGTVGGVNGELLMSANYSRVAPRHRLAAWVRLLALTAAWPQHAFTAATVGRATRGDDVRVARIPPLGEDPERRRATALHELERIIELFDRGMREPLPIFCKTSAAYAEAAAVGQDPEQAAQEQWESRWRFDGENRDLAHQLVLGGERTLTDVLAPVPEPGEAGDGSERSRLGQLARRLWGPLLEREELSQR